MTINVENINKTIERIRANKNFKFNMRSWGGNSQQVRDDKGHPCGTSACIAGFACLTSGKVPLVQRMYDIFDENEHYVESIEVDVLSFPGSSWDAPILAAEELGLDSEQASALFLPHVLSAGEDDVPGPDFFAANEEQGIKVLEHLRDTGIVDWTVSGIKAEDPAFYELWQKDNKKSFENSIRVDAR
jgi:hypothetical protein